MLAATGGTFDIIHRGHKALLSRAFFVSEAVIIGLTSDEFALKRDKKLLNKYGTRFENLAGMIACDFPKSEFRISRLDSNFGPAVLERGVEALVVSDETMDQGRILNGMRSKMGMPPVEVVVVPMEMADDGRRISTTRIRNSEIDADGRIP